jgi:hypothetical protein
MRVISHEKAARKLLLLFVLTGTLFYLRAPTRASGLTCQQECQVLRGECDTLCIDSHANEPLCIDMCTYNYNECIASCK